MDSHRNMLPKSVMGLMLLLSIFSPYSQADKTTLFVAKEITPVFKDGHVCFDVGFLDRLKKGIKSEFDYDAIYPELVYLIQKKNKQAVQIGIQILANVYDTNCCTNYTSTDIVRAIGSSLTRNPDEFWQTLQQMDAQTIAKTIMVYDEKLNLYGGFDYQWYRHELLLKRKDVREILKEKKARLK
jgi:hypothetical protein